MSGCALACAPAGHERQEARGEEEEEEEEEVVVVVVEEEEDARNASIRDAALAALAACFRLRKAVSTLASPSSCPEYLGLVSLASVYSFN